jgi:hypothetical protein
MPDKKKPTKEEIKALKKILDAPPQEIDHDRLQERIKEIKDKASRKQRQRLPARRSLRDFIDGKK